MSRPIFDRTFRKQLVLLGGIFLLLTGCGNSNSTPSRQPAQGNNPQSVTNQTNSTTDTSNNTAAGGTNDASTTNQTRNTTDPTSSPAPQTKSYAHAPEMKIDPSKGYVATVSTTDGSFQIQLFAKDAPVTVNNFVFLANDHFYDNIKFHRIIKSFMIQTGDPRGDGTGGPGYTIPDELPPRVPYGPGIVAMARTQAPHSGGSQFFICTGPDSETLPPDYTVFGKVISGMDTVNKIASTPVGPGGEDVPSKPVQDVHINTITVKETPGG